MKKITPPLLILLALFFSLPACTPLHGLAIISYPDNLKLQSEPDRYFRLSMDVTLDGQRHTINHIWSCSQEKVFSSAVGWGLRWKSESKYVVQTISKDTVVFFRQPAENYCLIDKKQAYVSDVGVIPNPNVLDNLIVHHVSFYPRSGAILRGSIERLDGIPDLLPYSRRDLSLANQLDKLDQFFVSKHVIITPESVWGRYPEMKSYFEAITEITVAPPPSLPDRIVGFPVWRRSWFTPEDLERRLYYSVKEVNGEIRFDRELTPDRSPIFVLDYSDFRRPIKFCYFEKCISLNEGSNYNEIYDPETRNIISVSSALGFRARFK